jgi:hypothetical protein
MSLLSLSDELSEGDREILTEALSKAEGQDDPREKAWTLRRALDAVYRTR